MIDLKEDSIKVLRTNLLLAGVFFPVTAVIIDSDLSSLPALFSSGHMMSRFLDIHLSIGFAVMSYLSASDSIDNSVPLDEFIEIVEQSDNGWEDVQLRSPDGELSGYRDTYEAIFAQNRKSIRETKSYNILSIFLLYAAITVLGLGTLNLMIKLPNWILSVVLIPFLFAIIYTLYLRRWEIERDLNNLLSSWR